VTTRRPSRFAQPGGRPPFDKTIQVAGVASYAEARMLLDCGVDYLGFPFRLSVHREDITERDAREIIRRVGAARAVAITYVDTARDARDLLETLGAAAIQLHGPIDVTEIALLRRACPNVAFIKSIVISPDEVPDVEELIRGYEPHVDAFITDT
jgi:phosphoribosylanthranilate isomerase